MFIPCTRFEVVDVQTPVSIDSLTVDDERSLTKWKNNEIRAHESDMLEIMNETQAQAHRHLVSSLWDSKDIWRYLRFYLEPSRWMSSLIITSQLTDIVPASRHNEHWIFPASWFVATQTTSNCRNSFCVYFIARLSYTTKITSCPVAATGCPLLQINILALASKLSEGGVQVLRVKLKFAEWTH